MLFVCEKKEKTSQYKGVSWHKESKNWHVQVRSKERKLKSGGYFKDELDAGKRVNQLCEEFAIPLHNPKISSVPSDKQYQVTKKFVLFHGVVRKSEL